jgi:hypothetical protein
MIQSMSVVLTGNKRRIMFATWKGIIVLAVVILTAVWLIKEPDRSRVMLFFRFLPLLTLLLLALKLFGAVSAFIAARRLVSGRDFLALAGLWSGVAALVLAAALLARAAPGMPSAILWFLVVLQYFPSGGIPAAVVNLTSNRHR